MSDGVTEIQVTIRQMNRMARALEGLSEDLLPQNPQLFALMAEAPLEHLSRMRGELIEMLSGLRQAAPVTTSTEIEITSDRSASI